MNDKLLLGNTEKENFPKLIYSCSIYKKNWSVSTIFDTWIRYLSNLSLRYHNWKYIEFMSGRSLLEFLNKNV